MSTWKRTETILHPTSLHERTKVETLNKQDVDFECLSDELWVIQNQVIVNRDANGDPERITMTFPWHSDATQRVNVTYERNAS